MISTISGGFGIHVNSGYTSQPYISPNPTNPVTGMIRLNGTNLEAFTGTSWLPINQTSASVELDAKIVDVLNWARRKMVEEERLEKLAAQVPAVADLKSKLDMMIALTKDYHGN